MNLGAYAFRDAIESSVRELPRAADPLRVDELLVEVYPVAVRIDAVRSRASVLLDCRFSDQIEGNSAILTIGLLSELRWLRNQEKAPAALTIVLWHVASVGQWSVRAGLGWAGDDELVLTGATALFVSGDIHGLDDAPPNFMTADADTIDAGLPNWDAPFVPRAFAAADR